MLCKFLYNDEILNSFSLEDTKSAINNKLKILLTELKGFNPA